MKNKWIFTILFQLTIFSSAFSQVNDSFTDGNFTDSPTWIGDTSNFTIDANNQLQLLAPAEANMSYLSTSSQIIENAEWAFYVRLEFNPSSNNYLDIYLASDNDNLKEPLNGYFVRVGNTQDEVSLYKQPGDKSGAYKLIDGIDDRVDQSLIALKIKVTKNEDQLWELFVDTDLNGNYLSEGTAEDGEIFYSSYFGILCNYTSTRSEKFFFDDLTITGTSFSDDIPPEVDSILVLSDSTLQINFSEKVSEATAANTVNYRIEESMENPYNAELQNDSCTLLSFQNKFEDKQTQTLAIKSVEDVFSNSMSEYTGTFTFYAPYIIGFGDILISEIMADPTPGVDLPEYEYLEIYNPSNTVFTIQDAKLIVGNDTAFIPDLQMNSNEYLIFCQHAAVEHFESYGRTIKITNWPSLNNRGETIILLNQKNEIVNSVTYDNTWYKSIDKDDGGWSLEMIDTDFVCKGMENWMASEDPNGGTPGQTNASTYELTDLSPPEIAKINAISDTSVMIYLTENIGPQQIITQDIAISPVLEIEMVQLIEPEFNQFTVFFNTPIQPNTQYILSLKNITDCVGNIQKETSSTFVLPEKAEILDLIINEILFNPKPAGVDFVEIYNQSEKYIDLNTIQIGNDDFKSISTDHFIMEPKQFLALTKDPETIKNSYPQAEVMNLYKMEDLSPLNDDEGNVILRNIEENTIDFVPYNDDWHSVFLKDHEGVSLERISFEGSSEDPDNWQSAASTSDFATPGSMNSQSMAMSIDSEEVTIDPQVFAPGNSGSHTFTTIKCRFQQSGNMASIKIVDPQGRVIKTIISHTSIAAEEDFKWEGEDDQGREVRMGPYIVYLEIYNSLGDKKLIRKKVVVGGSM